MSPKEEQILLAAESLFAKKGFTATSTREISKEAGANISLISYYFGSKEKLYERVFEYRLKEGYTFAIELVDTKDIPTWDKLSRVVDRYVDRVNSLKDFYAIMQREQLNKGNDALCKFLQETKRSYVDIYKKLIAEGVKSGVFKNKPDFSFIHSFISGTLFAARNNLPMYKEYYGKKNEDKYYQDVKIQFKAILKYLLGYEENA